MNEPYSISDLVRLALVQFPELREDLADEQGNVTLQTSIFAQRMQKAKGGGDWDAYRRAVQIVDELWRRPDERLYTAIRLTLMKSLDFDGPRGPQAWSLLSPELQHVWEGTRRHLDSLRVRPPKP